MFRNHVVNRPHHRWLSEHVDCRHGLERPVFQLKAPKSGSNTTPHGSLVLGEQESELTGNKNLNLLLNPHLLKILTGF